MIPTRPHSTARTLITGFTLAVIVVGLGIFVSSESTDGTEDSPRESTRSLRGARGVDADAPPIAPAEVEARPAHISLGTRSPCDGAVRTEVELFNRGKTPASIAGWLVSSSAIVVDAQPGFTLAPGESCKIELRVSPWSYGVNRQGVEFRVKESPSVRLGVDWEVQSAIWAKPSLIVRPTGNRPRRVVLERIGIEGAFFPEPFTVLSVSPLVAFVDEAAPVESGVATLLVDFHAIDEMASTATKDDHAFTFGAAGRWKTLEILVRTDCGACPELHLSVRNN